MLSADLQKAAVAAMAASTSISNAVGGRIYGDPPQDAVYPFIRFGRYDRIPDDTTGTYGSSLVFSIEIHDRPKQGGRIAAYRIADDIIDLLHNQESQLSIQGHTVWGVFLTGSNLTRDADGLSYVFVLSFEARTQNNG